MSHYTTARDISSGTDNQGRPPAEAFKDPYRLGCPRGHVFLREIDPGADEVHCWSCDEGYFVEALVDRKLDTWTEVAFREGR